MKATCLTGLLAVLIVGPVANAETLTSEQMMQELKALRAEVATLRADQDGSWMNERRAEEIKTLVREVLSDAETRASLLDSALTAGHNGQHFFLSSDDGAFLMMIDGQIQFRHVWNSRDDTGETTAGGNNTTQDNGISGFELARTKLRFSGHIADPRLHYVVQLDVDRDSNEVNGDIITIGYDLTDNLKVWVGEDKGPFMREELVDSRYQLAVDRSYVNELFTTGVVQGIWLQWTPMEEFVITTSINDGGLSGEADGANTYLGAVATAFDVIDNEGDTKTLQPTPTDKGFDQDGSDFAFTVRGEYLLAGGWSQATDFTSAPGEEMFLLLGGAIHWQEAETGGASAAALGTGAMSDDILSWTVDVSFEQDGWNAFFAYVGVDTNYEDRVAAGLGVVADEPSPWAIVLQGGYAFEYEGDVIEPFVRYEHIDFDVDETGPAGPLDTGYNSSVNILTLGMNWYHKRHAAKFTTDVMIAFDPIPVGYAPIGLLQDNAITAAGGGPVEADEQVVWRMQYQLLF